MVMYATRSDIEARIGADVLVMLADDNDDGVADIGVIDAAISQASARIDAAFGGRYSVPIEPPPAVIVWVCVSLAVPILYARRREEMPPDHKSQADAAGEFLTSLASGEIVLSGVSTRTLPRSTTMEKDRHFSPENLCEF